MAHIRANYIHTKNSSSSTPNLPVVVFGCEIILVNNGELIDTGRPRSVNTKYALLQVCALSITHAYTYRSKKGQGTSKHIPAYKQTKPSIQTILTNTQSRVHTHTCTQ